MFNLKNIKKESFSFKNNSLDSINKYFDLIVDVGFEDDRNDAQKEEFKNNYNEIGNVICSNFDIIIYCEFCCQHNQRVLILGFREFRYDVFTMFGFDVHEVISMSSLSDKVFKNSVYDNPNINCYGGTVKGYIKQAVYGGRRKTNSNKKYYSKHNAVNFDQCHFIQMLSQD